MLGSYWFPAAEQKFNTQLSPLFTAALAVNVFHPGGICLDMNGTGLNRTRPGNSNTLSLRVRGSPISPGGRASLGYQTRVVQVLSAATQRGG